MEKYASMWRGETPIERQDHAVDMWNNLAGGVIPKEDVSSRLEKLFPQTHTKEAAYTKENPLEHIRESKRLGAKRGARIGAIAAPALTTTIAAARGNRIPILGAAVASGLGGVTGSAIGGALGKRSAIKEIEMMRRLKEQEKKASLGSLTAKQLIGGAALLGGSTLAARSLSRSRSDGRQSFSPERSMQQFGPGGAKELTLYRKSGDTQGQRDAATARVAYRHGRMQGDKRSKLKEKMLDAKKGYADAAAKHRLLAAGAAGLGGGAVAGLAARAAARKFGLS